MAEKITFSIKRPRSDRKSFAVSKRIKRPDGSSTYSTVKSEQVDSINKHFLDGHIDYASAIDQLKQILKKLYAELPDRVTDRENFNSENEALLDRYWAKEYSQRILVDPDSMKNSLTRAIVAVGPLSLISADRNELQARINNYYPKANKHRVIIARLNQLLKFAERDFILTPKKKEYSEVRHLNYDDFNLLAAKFPPESVERTVLWVAFGTGCRIGEIFNLSDRVFKDKFINLKNQVDRNFEVRQTKNRKERNVYVIPESECFVKAWLAIPSADKLLHRNRPWHEVVKKACREIWPKEPAKHLTFHDLRHSYAINLLSRGVSLTLLAKMLGDSISVTEQYYSGSVANADTIDLIHSIYNKK